MSHKLIFEKLVDYDRGRPGITLGVELRIAELSISVDAKLDSGSSLCVFERKVGESLGLDVESGNPKAVSTATGSFRVFGHNVTLTAEGFEFDSEVFFPELESVHRTVLGRHGWLDRMVVAINDYDGKLYLQPYNDQGP